jgi:very-short-patch-repair endonuclease
MTTAEKMLWSKLRNKQIKGKRLLRQYSVEKYVIDFYCPELKLAIEVDGVTHSSPEEIEDDNRRQSIIENYHITFIRIKNEQVYRNLNEVILRIEKKIDELVGKLTPPPSPPL